MDAQVLWDPLGTCPEDPEVILPSLRHQESVMTFSDSRAHVSQVIDSSIQAHLLAYWVRQRQDLTLEEAVRMLPSATADAWGFTASSWRR